MALVDFSKLPLYDMAYDTNEPPIFTAPEDPSYPSGIWTGTVYHGLWGYFTFQQSLTFEYNKSERYKSMAIFTLEGVFTVNAEFPPGAGNPDNLDVNVPVHPEDPATGHDESRFNALRAKYDALRAVFSAAGASSPPAALNQYGTALDPRCIALPYPLVDVNNAHVYGKPRSLNIAETQWPNLIKYTAVLEEVLPPPCKVELDDYIINKSTITIRAKKPRIKLQNFAFANSSDVYFNGWEPRSYEVSGTYPDIPPSGQVSTDKITGLINNLMDGRVNIGKRLFDGTHVDIATDLFVDQSSISVTPSEEDKGTQIRVTARE